PAIAAIEAADQPLAPVAARRFGIDQRLHFVAPSLAFVGAAYRAQIVERAENLGEPLHVGLVRRARALSRTGREARAERDEDGSDEMNRGTEPHRRRYAAPGRCPQAQRQRARTRAA